MVVSLGVSVRGGSRVVLAVLGYRDEVVIGAVLGYRDEVVIGALMGVVLLAFGSYLLYRGVKNLGRGYAIWTHDPVTAGSVHLERDVVEVEGEARPIDSTVSARYSGTNCLSYTYERKEKRRTVDSDGNTKTKWRTVDSGTVTHPFELSDDTGSVAVDPTDATLSFNDDVVSSTGSTKEIEGRLDVGETVHVYGQKLDGATTGEAPGDGSVYVGAGDDASTFTVSDTSENWTVVRFFAVGTGNLLLGSGMLGAVALVVLAFFAGGFENIESLLVVVDAGDLVGDLPGVLAGVLAGDLPGVLAGVLAGDLPGVLAGVR